MQINRSAAVGEKPVLALQLSSPFPPHKGRKVRKFSSARLVTPPVQPADVGPLWTLAKSSLASCARPERVAWLALALGSAAMLIWSFLSLLA